MLAGLPYVVWPIGSAFILLSRKKEEPFLNYHAWQALLAGGVMAVTLAVLTLALFLFFRVMPGSTHYASVTFGLLVMCGGGALLLGVLLAALFLGWRATEGEMLRLPVLGDFAEEKMLDMTGMTRRQFETMLETSLHPIKDEAIPFPETTEVTPEPRTTNRLEAMRQARESTLVEAPPPLQNTPRTTQPMHPLGPAPGPRQSQAAQGYRPPEPPRPPATSPQVREVDLIGHYREKRVDPNPQKSDVLRQWLSSVDD